jgi:hypothetical protein
LIDVSFVKTSKEEIKRWIYSVVGVGKAKRLNESRVAT